MYFLLILFFGSLFAIIFMIGRKLMLVQDGEVLERAESILKIEHLEELKHVTVRGIKKHSYNALVVIIRLYFRTANFLKYKYKEIKINIKKIGNKNPSDETIEKKEVSKFLKMIGEYKHKIRRIKQKVKEEENL